MQKFDEIKYWKARHNKMRGDIRAVTNLKSKLEDGIKASDAFVKSVGELAKKIFSPIEDQSVLDLACGIGRLCPILTQLGFKYTGVDISGTALEQARENCLNGQFIEKTITNFRMNIQFDLVIASYILVHMVDDTDWNSALDRIVGALKPNGLLLFIDELPSERRVPAPHVVERSHNDYKRAFQSRGLEFTNELKGKSPKRFYTVRFIK